MSKHLFGAIVTPHGIAANNRGENEGNLTTLQKVLWNGEVHSTVSAEAIRWAIRADWQRRKLPVNRTWDEATRRHAWQDQEFLQSGQPFVDGRRARIYVPAGDQGRGGRRPGGGDGGTATATATARPDTGAAFAVRGDARDLAEPLVGRRGVQRGRRRRNACRQPQRE